MIWLNWLLCALGREDACPPHPAPAPDMERAHLRSRLDRAVTRHHLDDDRDERRMQALDVEIAVQARRDREGRGHAAR